MPTLYCFSCNMDTEHDLDHIGMTKTGNPTMQYECTICYDTHQAEYHFDMLDEREDPDYDSDWDELS